MKLRDYRLLLQAYAERKQRRFELRWWTVGYVVFGTVLTLAALVNAFGIHAEQPYPATSATHFFGTGGVVSLGTVQVPHTPIVSVQTLAQDTFQREKTEGWNPASDGKNWQGDNFLYPSEFSVHAGAGQIAQSAGKRTVLLGPVTHNAEVLIQLSISSFLDTATSVAAIIRYSDENTWDKAAIDGQHLLFVRHAEGKNSTLASVPFPASPGVTYTIRVQSDGDLLDANAWQMGTPEPTRWMLQAQDTVLTSGLCGIRAILQPDVVARITSFRVQALSV